MLCGEASLVNHHGDGSVAIAMRCRAWTCETCRPVRRRQLIHDAAAGEPNRLVTLTVSPGVGISPADRAAKLARAWRIVVARAKRQFKLPELQYFAVFEATRRGEPHLHILVRSAFIPQSWLSQQMRDILGSPIVDIRRINGVRHAVRYVAKYIGKAPQRFATCKRYWHTQGWLQRQPGEDEPEKWLPEGWYQSKDMVHWIAKAWEQQGKAIVWVNEDIVYTGLPPPWAEGRASHGAGRTPS